VSLDCLSQRHRAPSAAAHRQAQQRTPLSPRAGKGKASISRSAARHRRAAQPLPEASELASGTAPVCGAHASAHARPGGPERHLAEARHVSLAARRKLLLVRLLRCSALLLLLLHITQRRSTMQMRICTNDVVGGVMVMLQSARRPACGGGVGAALHEEDGKGRVKRTRPGGMSASGRAARVGSRGDVMGARSDGERMAQVGRGVHDGWASLLLLARRREELA